MPWSRSATTVRIAPALGFKQQYAGDEMDGESMDGVEVMGSHREPVNGCNVDNVEEEVMNDLAKADNATPAEQAELYVDAKDLITATLHEKVDEVEELTNDLEKVTDAVVEEFVEATEGKDVEGPSRRFQLMKQIHIKHLQKRLANIRASKMLGARVQPYARPARHVSARAAPSPISTSRLARRMQRTRF